MAMNFQTPPPIGSTFALSFPYEGILVATITRERQMNSIPLAGHLEGADLWAWFDDEPSLCAAIVTGQGKKAFCAGADLLEQRDNSEMKGPRPTQLATPGGFAGLSQRWGKKPVIAAVNGFALGGGFEICVNCDMVVASPTASFALPEVERGLYAGAGGLSRIVRIVGLQLASELALTGRRLTAAEAKELHLVNKVSASPEAVMDDALAMARKLASLSPDAVIVSRSGLRQSLETGSVERASQLTAEKYGRALMHGENLKIGLAAFAQKKKPKWVGSKL